MQKVSIIGVGRVGGAIALALPTDKYQVENLISRSSTNAIKVAESLDSNPKVNKLNEVLDLKGKIVFITTQDTEISKIADKLAKNNVVKDSYIFHMSGSLTSEVLEQLKENGNQIGSIHPLISISDSFIGAEKFNGAYFCIEGDDEAVELAKNIVENINGSSFSVKTKYKTLYHASAVTASGHLIALIDTSVEMLKKCGIKRDEAKRILLPLVKSTVENMEELSLSKALTGTFARADLDTLEKHIETLEQNVTDEQLETYLLLGEQSLSLAKRQGADEKTLNKMAKRISLAKKNFKC